MAEPEMRYVSRTPKKVPEGKIVVHNFPAPENPNREQGEGGFRIWTSTPHPNWVRCDCGWGPWLPEHYRSRPHYEDWKKIGGQGTPTNTPE